MGFDEAEAAYNRQRKRKNKSKGKTRQEREEAATVLRSVKSGKQTTRADVYSKSQIVGAINTHKEEVDKAGPSKQVVKKKAKAKAKAQTQYQKDLAKVKSDGWQINGLPVIEVNGKLQYDVNKIGETLGMDPAAVAKAAKTKFGSRRTSTKSKLEDMLETGGRQTTGGGSGSNESARSTQWAKNTKGMNELEAIISNLSQLDPISAQVDLNKEDHMWNMSKAGHFYDIGNMDVKKRLGDSPAASGMGKYAQKYMVPAIGAAMTAMTMGTASPFLTPAVAGGVGALTSAQQGGDWQDILKSAAMGAGTSAIGSQAGKLVSGIGGAGVGGEMVRGGLKNVISSTGGEILSSTLGGEKFDPMNIVKSGAQGAATAGAKVGLESMLEGTKAGDFIFGDEAGGGGPGGTSGKVAPSSLEVSASPGDIGATGDSLIGAAKFDVNRLAATDFGYGGPGSLGSNAGNISTISSPTGPEGLTTDEPDMRSIPAPGDVTGGVEPQNMNLDKGPTTVGATEGSVDPTVMGRPIGGDSQYVNQFETDPTLAAMRTDPFSPPVYPGQHRGSNDPTVQGKPVGAPDTYTNVFGDEPGAVGPTEYPTSTWSEFGKNAIGPVIGSLLSNLGGGGGSSRQRSGTGIGGGSVTAGQYDPTSELQVMSTGLSNVNPGLSEFTEFADSEEENKKRKQLWMQNPVLEG